jgi:hypothetical protein
MTYFDHPAVSNSDLGKLKAACNCSPDYLSGAIDALNFGSLVDAMLTEAWRVDPVRMCLNNEKGERIYFEPDVYIKAVKLASAAKEDPFIKQLIPHLVGQYVFIRTLKFVYDEEEYSILGKCKFDGFAKKFGTGCDYKTVAAKNQKQFIETIDFFDWDKQASWYMDLAQIDKHWILGLSKSTGKILKYAVQRGDEMYESGKRKYSFWAYKWVTLIDGF